MVFSNNLLLGAGGQSTGQAPFDTTLIGNSVWLDGSADFLSADLGAKTRTKAVIGTWIQKTGFTTSDATIFSKKGTAHFAMRMQDQASKAGKISIFDYDGGSFQYNAESTSMLLRDNGWYHIMISIDTTAIAGNRLRYYINGIDQTSTLTVTTDYTASDNPSITGGTGEPTQWGVGYAGNNQFNPCYLAQSFMLDDDSIQNGDVAVTDILAAFTLGTNGSQFTPKSDAAIAALATTAGGDSFCLDFSNSGSLGLDSSTPANNFTPTSMDSSNQSTSTPSLTFSTYNILDANSAYTSTNDGANTYVVTNVGGAGMRASLPMSSGKWYWEQRNGGSNECGPAISAGAGFVNLATNSIIGEGSGSHSVYLNYLGLVRIDASTGSSIGVTNGTTAVMGVAFDADTGKVWFRDSSGFGTSGDPANGTGEHATLAATSAPFFIGARVGGAVAEPFLNAGGNPTFNGNETAGGNADANGRGNFKLGAVPTGFLSLNTANLSAPDYQGIDYFAPTLYEGNGTGQRVGDFVPFTDAFNVANSAMFQHDEARALKRTIGTPSSSGGKKGTWSTWYKTANIDTDNIFFDNGTTASNRFSLNMDASGQIIFSHKGVTILKTGVPTIPADFKGGGLWRNVVLKVDTELETASARAAMFIDGVEQTTFEEDRRDDTDLTRHDEIGYMESGATQFVGSYDGSSANQWDGYLAETIFLDDQFLSADSFGQLDTSTNKWVPKDISGETLGNQGFYLAYGGDFDTGNGAGDSTGNSNNLTVIGTGAAAWTSADQFVDTPTKNFTIFDSGYSGGGSNVWSEGNTKVKGTDGSLSDSSTTTFGMTGKVVFQFQINTVVSGGYPQVGFITSQTGLSAINAASGSIEMGTASVPGSFAYTDTGTFKIPAGTESTTFSSVTSLQALDADDVIRFEVDTSTGTIRAYFQNEGTGSFSEITGARVDNFSFDPSFGIRPAVSNYNNSIVTLQTGGQTALASVTTDYKEINQDNLDDTASKLTALAWIKNRDAADDNIWMDRVIGTGGYLSTTQNDSGTAATAYGDGGTDVLTANINAVQRFLQRGVQIGSDENVNTANESYVLWQWLLGDSATTGSSITTGSPSLATTGIVSDANHFSIVQYTGNGIDNATFAHGLGSIPNLVMIKRRSGTALNSDWVMHIVGLGTENYIYPHYRIALSSGAGPNGMVPDADLVEISTGVATNTSGQTHMAYSFKNTPGLCKIGTYTGNSSANGTYVSTGFRPSWLWIFNTTLTSADAERPIIDTARYRFNGATTAGGINGGINFSDQRAAEEAQTTSLGVNPAIDILSDGFKLRANDSTINTGTTYMYICMADIAGNGTLPPVYGR